MDRPWAEHDDPWSKAELKYPDLPQTKVGKIDLISLERIELEK
jgi:hypothetical protein